MVRLGAVELETTEFTAACLGIGVFLLRVYFRV